MRVPFDGPRLTALFSSAALTVAQGCRNEQRRADSTISSAANTTSVAAPIAPLPSASPRPVSTANSSAGGLTVRNGTIQGETLWGFTELALDLGRVRIEVATKSRGVPLQTLLLPRALAVINGGYFEADFRPSSWLRSNGVDLSPRVATSKGGVLAIANGRSFVGPLPSLPFEPELAIQSFPLIVEPDGRAGIHGDDGKRAARTVACATKAGLSFVLIHAPRGEGPTLFETVPLLRDAPPKGFGCRAALNLDGGPSAGVYFAPELPMRSRPPFAPVAYGIAVLPKE